MKENPFATQNPAQEEGHQKQARIEELIDVELQKNLDSFYEESCLGKTEEDTYGLREQLLRNALRDSDYTVEQFESYDDKEFGATISVTSGGKKAYWAIVAQTHIERDEEPGRLTSYFRRVRCRES